MTTSQPIKDVEMINRIKDLFLNKGQMRGYLLFVLSINTGIKLKELLDLKVKDVKNKQYLKYDKSKTVPLSPQIQELIKEVVDKSKMDDPLFKNRQGQPLDRISVFYVFKQICSELGVQNEYSVSSWRKTFAYHYYRKYKDLAYLQWLFNQSSVEQALKYIGQDENMNLRYREGVCL